MLAAIVAVAGVVNGTPLAEGLDDIYRRLGMGFPMPDCARGNGEEVTDMRRERRLDWWRHNGNAIDVPLYSLGAVPRPGSVSPVLATKYRRLALIDPRNDGQLLWYDAIAPRGNLLGYVNADHWTIAIDLKKQLPQMADMFHDQVPRTALVEAAIDVVDRQPTAAARRAEAPLDHRRADPGLRQTSDVADGRLEQCLHKRRPPSWGCRSSLRAQSRSRPRTRCASSRWLPWTPPPGRSQCTSRSVCARHADVFMLAIPNAVTHLGWYALAIAVGTLLTTVALLVLRPSLDEPTAALALASSNSPTSQNLG